ncbi:AAA family ATPase [Methylocella sp.]|uniref:AAA family ATPase n=1 Tax=Methylocella sp. TaxID=1978226 RepID=UPI0037848E43
MTSIPVPPGAEPFIKARRWEPSINEGETRARFSLIPFGKIKLDTTPSYLVKGLVPRVGLTVVWGPPKCGKSFFVFDLMMHVAMGWTYRERKVRQGSVVYCALEGADGFRARVEAFRQAKMAEGSDDVPFSLVASPMSLVADHAALVEAIRRQLGALPPAAVVIDTLNRSLAGSESDDRDMAAYVQAADAIKAAFSCAVVVVHHCGHEGTRPRGHSSLMGALDAQIAIERDGADNVVATVEFMKDGPADAEIVSRLEPVEVGIDDDGDPITSLVVMPVEGVSMAKKESRPRLPRAAAAALLSLQKAVLECGAVPPASNHIPAGVSCVTLDQWREYAYRQGLSASEEPRARQQAFKRAVDALITARCIGVWTPYYWQA